MEVSLRLKPSGAIGAPPFFMVLNQRKKLRNKLYQKNTKWDVRPGSISQLRYASGHVEEEMQDSKSWIPRCVKISQILFQILPGLDYTGMIFRIGLLFGICLTNCRNRRLIRRCPTTIYSSLEKSDRIEYTCYVSPVLTTLKTVKYTKHTCTLARFHIMAISRY